MLFLQNKQWKITDGELLKQFDSSVERQKKRSFKDEIRKWHVWKGSHSALLFSHSDCSVFLLGHVLYRRGVGGPSGRVSLEDERYVPCFLQNSLIDFWFPM